MHRGRILIMSMCSLCISQIIYVFSSALNPGNKGTALIRSWVPVVVTITFDFNRFICNMSTLLLHF